jgi:hypothetical protein
MHTVARTSRHPVISDAYTTKRSAGKTTLVAVQQPEVATQVCKVEKP